MSIKTILVLVFLCTHSCIAGKDSTPVPVVTDFVSDSTGSQKTELTSTGMTGTGTPTTSTSAGRTTVVVTDASFFFSDGKATNTRFIPALTCDCRRLMEEYARSSSMFMHCALLHAKPLLLCETCVTEYQDLGKKFGEIEKSDCDGSLLSSDRVQILRETHDFVMGLWRKGNCESCFKNLKGCNGNHTEKCQITEKVHTFQTYNNLTLDCFETAYRNNEDICINCSSIYRNLSKFYSDMGEVEEICMDCVELMNSTRKEWSITYNCTYTRKDVVSIVAISVFFCSLPLFFYIGSKIHTVKTEHKLMKQNRLVRSTRRPRRPVAAISANRESYLTEDSHVNTI